MFTRNRQNLFFEFQIFHNTHNKSSFLFYLLYYDLQVSSFYTISLYATFSNSFFSAMDNSDLTADLSDTEVNSTQESENMDEVSHIK